MSKRLTVKQAYSSGVWTCARLTVPTTIVFLICLIRTHWLLDKAKEENRELAGQLDLIKQPATNSIIVSGNTFTPYPQGSLQPSSTISSGYAIPDGKGGYKFVDKEEFDDVGAVLDEITTKAAKIKKGTPL